MKAAHGVDFEDIYFSEIFAGSEPQNTTTTKFFCGPDALTLTGSAPIWISPTSMNCKHSFTSKAYGSTISTCPAFTVYFSSRS